MSPALPNETEERHKMPDGTPKKTGRQVFESVVTIRVDETQADNPRVAIHVEHPAHDGGVRCFYRRRDSDVTGSIRSHLRNLDAEPVRVEVIDEVGVGIAEADLLPRELARETPFDEPTAVEVSES